MKTIKLLFLLCVTIFAVSCSSKKEGERKAEEHVTATSTDEDWPAMDEFHMIMAETFHPFKDSANLEPIKTKASELAASAEKWLNAPLPEKVNNDEVKTKLQQLKTDAATLSETVKSADDKTIGESLTKVHDLFHEIQEAWYGGREDN